MKSLIRERYLTLHAYEPGEQPRIPGLIKLNTNENPYPPSPRIAEWLNRHGIEQLRLYPDPLCVELRERLAALNGCTADQIFVGNGSDEVLRLCVQAFTEPGGTVEAFDPTYSLYPVLAEIEGLVYRRFPLAGDFTWVPPQPVSGSLFFLAIPNAPTGIQYPYETVRAFCRTYPGVVVLDEAYVDFAPFNCMPLALELPNVLVARTFSKSWSLAGLRLGYIAGARELIAAFYKIKDSYNIDRMAQGIAVAAVEDAPYMRANVAVIKATRDRTAQALAQRGFQVCPSASNFLWVRPPTPADVLFRQLRENRILVRYFPGPRTGAYLRISIGTAEQMEALLQVLDHVAGGAAL